MADKNYPSTDIGMNKLTLFSDKYYVVNDTRKLSNSREVQSVSTNILKDLGDTAVR